MTWRFGEAFSQHPLFIYHDFAGEILQAFAAPNRAYVLNRDHPELHNRLIYLNQTGKLVSSHDLGI
jgi:hypothetical protein